MKYIFAFFIVVFIVLTCVGGGYWVFQSKYFVQNTRASQVALSPESSVAFVSPSSLPLASKGRIQVTIFCLDTRGLGIPSLQTKIAPHVDALVLEEESITDEKGKATYFIQGSRVGSYDLDVYCQGQKIESKVSFSLL